MKKYFSLSAALLAGIGCAGAQGLFDIAQDDEAQESLPLQWSVSGSVGYDDNVVPLSGIEDSSMYVAGYVGASMLNHSPQSTLDINARLGYIHYLDDVVGMQDDGSVQARLGLNWAHRVNERLRFSSRNYVAYEREPDYSWGYAGAQQTGEYLFWSSDNAVGYRWTERLATYTGIKFTGVEYDDAPGQDRNSWGAYHQFRYQFTPQTIVTFDYRYDSTNGKSLADSENHFFLLGVEQRFSPQTVGVFRAGLQERDVDGGASNSNLYIEGALNTQVNESLSLNAFVRYGTEDYNRRIGAAIYDDSNTLRIGAKANYAVSPRLTLHGGAHYLAYGYEEGRFGAPDVDEDLFNVYAGFTFEVRENLYLNGSYNFDTYSSDVNFREYDRNRFNLGVQMVF
ncbi:MAG: outer membrane beta-barrel protein [Verrucomicrobiales bacterium]